MALQQQPVYRTQEDEILAAMIGSTPFMSRAAAWYKPEYFKDYAQLIAGWVMEYYRQYKEAPGQTIQHIYTIEKENIPPAMAVNVATYLSNLSTQYGNNGFNLDYLLDTARKFFRRRSYEYFYSTGRDLIRAGRVEEAITLHDDFRNVIQATSGWENPFDEKVINDHFREDLSEYQVLSFRGVLNELIGPLERSWLVAFMGPMKRGKSFWCEEAIFAGLSQQKRVAYINLEMPGRAVRTREYKRITALPERNSRYVLPQFDCLLNQTGVCVLPERTGGGILVQDDQPPQYTPGHPWRVCTYCREHRSEIRQKYNRNSYAAAIWFSHVNKLSLNPGAVHKEAQNLKMLSGDHLRQKTYPAYSATVEDVRRDLDDLMYAERFYPDIVVLDYADILGSERSFDHERHRLDNIWKRLKQAAAEMGALWITATQTNRRGMERHSVKQTDTAEDIRKMAHVDAMWGLNQTEDDRQQYFTRISQLASRHREAADREVMVLHQLQLGLPYLDSEWYPKREPTRPAEPKK